MRLKKSQFLMVNHSDIFLQIPVQCHIMRGIKHLCSIMCVKFMEESDAQQSFESNSWKVLYIQQLINIVKELTKAEIPARS